MFDDIILLTQQQSKGDEEDNIIEESSEGTIRSEDDGDVVDINNIKGGFRIMSVKEGSPADMAGLEAYFDYIVGLNEVEVTNNNEEFSKIINEHEEKLLKLEVYSLKTLNIREVNILPHRAWSNNGRGGGSMLGIIIHYETSIEDDGRSNSLRVLEVFKHSPAEVSGLMAGYDYLIQMVYNYRILRNINDLIDEINKYWERYNDKNDNNNTTTTNTLDIYVYNSKINRVWICHLIPSYNWDDNNNNNNNRSCLGCDLGQGVLHRIPPLNNNNTTLTIIQENRGDGGDGINIIEKEEEEKGDNNKDKEEECILEKERGIINNNKMIAKDSSDIILLLPPHDIDDNNDKCYSIAANKNIINDKKEEDDDNESREDDGIRSDILLKNINYTKSVSDDDHNSGGGGVIVPGEIIEDNGG